MALVVLRSVFVLVAAGIGYQLIQSDILPKEPAYVPWLAMGGMILLAGIVIATDILVGRKRLDTITAVYFGLLIGLLLTYVLTIALSPVLPDRSASAATWLPLVLGMVLCYTCISMLHANQGRFSLHHSLRGIRQGSQRAQTVRTRHQRGHRWPYCRRGRDPHLDNQLIMPRFVIAELQTIADSNDRLRRSRGRRGLDILNRLRSDPKVDLQIYDRELPEMAGQPVDHETGAAGQAPGRQGRHQRLQPEQGRQAARRAA